MLGTLACQQTTGSPAPPPVVMVADAGPTRSHLPMRTLPCIDDAAELVVGDLPDGDAGFTSEAVLVCWGDDCLVNERSAKRPPTPPEPTSPATVVESAQVCTGTRCEPLGAKLRQRLTHFDGQALATADHSMVALPAASSSEVWNRALDRPVALPRGQVADLRVLDDSVLVSFDCAEVCNSTSVVLDARGRRLGEGFDTAFPNQRQGVQGGDDVVELVPHRYVVFASFGSVTLLDHHRPVAFASLDSHARPFPTEITIQFKRLHDSQGVGLRWCDGLSCHLGALRVDDSDPKHLTLSLEETGEWPRCPQP